ncbi:class I SAM-dependent methyltransferase [Methylobacterium sp. W2]|uniref:class I SAM-dependent methyltransferase n=1 Tax=Methylobacterium sp. W2 TaxID=2598107 RepID=UPI001D0C528A|nr:class I SAM-dependent methyltransferase [Methylobacterium sp. W2]MCC0809031.1 class I SAM-dependent methyltransferase [Methylobacterium sp. W2]
MVHSERLGTLDFVAAFDDPAAAAKYSEGPRRFVPGLDALHRMTAILLAETAPRDARVLVLGAGGGLELQALAEAQPNWTFIGVDPAREMLLQAERTLGSLIERVTLVQGYIDDAPAGPFDAAVCLLTLHFLDAAEREATVNSIRQRMRPGAPFVVAHASFPQAEEERGRWLKRYEAYAVASGAEPAMARKARAAVDASLPALGPEEDATILRAGGFRDVAMFYAAFTFRGWIARA